MKIDPQIKLKNTLFYNNICLIICIFCILCFWTALSFQNGIVTQKTYEGLKENALFGPIEVKDKSQIYTVIAYFGGDNTNTYISGEVLDEDKDTLYEFGKDLWHESGRDSEGYWSESVREMRADLTFSEKGKYYLQFHTDENNINNIRITLQIKKGSYIAHLQVGMLFFLILLSIWNILNKKWVREKMSIINDKLEEMSDED